MSAINEYLGTMAFFGVCLLTNYISKKVFNRANITSKVAWGLSGSMATLPT